MKTYVVRLGNGSRSSQDASDQVSSLGRVLGKRENVNYRRDENTIIIEAREDQIGFVQKKVKSFADDNPEIVKDWSATSGAETERNQQQKHGHSEQSKGWEVTVEALENELQGKAEELQLAYEVLEETDEKLAESTTLLAQVGKKVGVTNDPIREADTLLSRLEDRIEPKQSAEQRESVRTVTKNREAKNTLEHRMASYENSEAGSDVTSIEFFEEILLYSENPGTYKDRRVAEQSGHDTYESLVDAIQKGEEYVETIREEAKSEFTAKIKALDTVYAGEIEDVGRASKENPAETKDSLEKRRAKLEGLEKQLAELYQDSHEVERVREEIDALNEAVEAIQAYTGMKQNSEVYAKDEELSDLKDVQEDTDTTLQIIRDIYHDVGHIEIDYTVDDRDEIAESPEIIIGMPGIKESPLNVVVGGVLYKSLHDNLDITGQIELDKNSRNKGEELYLQTNTTDMSAHTEALKQGKKQLKNLGLETTINQIYRRTL